MCVCIYGVCLCMWYVCVCMICVCVVCVRYVWMCAVGTYLIFTHDSIFICDRPMSTVRTNGVTQFHEISNQKKKSQQAKKNS